MQRLYVETRSVITGNKLEGYASVFDQATLLRSGYEVIARGAFDDVLRGNPDVRALFNHEESQLLGRTSSGTLRVYTDSRGLGYELELPNTQVGRDVRELAERGDLSGSSFAFAPGLDSWARAQDGKPVRTHTKIRELRDVSPVTFPAYEGTSVELRSLQISPVDHRRENLSRLIRARHQDRSST